MVLATLINRNALEALAGGTAFRRGEDYFSVGAVGGFVCRKTRSLPK